jgi:hypothetical protein
VKTNATLERTELKELDSPPEYPSYWKKSSWVKEQLLSPGGLCILGLLILSLGFVIFGRAKMNRLFADGNSSGVVSQPSARDSSLLNSAMTTIPADKFSPASASASPAFNGTNQATLAPSAAPLIEPALVSRTTHPRVYTIAEPGTTETRLKTIVNQ